MSTSTLFQILTPIFGVLSIVLIGMYILSIFFPSLRKWRRLSYLWQITLALHMIFGASLAGILSKRFISGILTLIALFALLKASNKSGTFLLSSLTRIFWIVIWGALFIILLLWHLKMISLVSFSFMS